MYIIKNRKIIYKDSHVFYYDIYEYQNEFELIIKKEVNGFFGKRLKKVKTKSIPKDFINKLPIKDRSQFMEDIITTLLDEYVNYHEPKPLLLKCSEEIERLYK